MHCQLCKIHGLWGGEIVQIWQWCFPLHFSNKAVISQNEEAPMAWGLSQSISVKNHLSPQFLSCTSAEVSSEAQGNSLHLRMKQFPLTAADIWVLRSYPAFMVHYTLSGWKDLCCQRQKEIIKVKIAYWNSLAEGNCQKTMDLFLWGFFLCFKVISKAAVWSCS